MEKLLTLIPEPFRSVIAPIFNRYIKPLESGKLREAFNAVQATVATRLDHDGHSLKDDGAEWMIHAAEYLLWKHAFHDRLGVPMRFADVLAAEIRRPHFPKVLEIAKAGVTENSTTADIVRVTADAALQVTL